MKKNHVIIQTPTSVTDGWLMDGWQRWQIQYTPTTSYLGVWIYCACRYIHGSVEDCSESSALAMELPQACAKISRIILGMGSANERRRYYVMPSLIGRARTQNGSWILLYSISHKMWTVFSAAFCYGCIIRFHRIYVICLPILFRVFHWLALGQSYHCPYEVITRMWVKLTITLPQQSLT